MGISPYNPFLEAGDGERINNSDVDVIEYEEGAIFIMLPAISKPGVQLSLLLLVVMIVLYLFRLALPAIIFK